jgi:hypothetical protein
MKVKRDWIYVAAGMLFFSSVFVGLIASAQEADKLQIQQEFRRRLSDSNEVSLYVNVITKDPSEKQSMTAQLQKDVELELRDSDIKILTKEELEYTPGWTHANGDPAYLFSSANKKTVIRHFQWMETYGIDGFAVQRFVSGLNFSHPHESFRITCYAREAANRTGRTYFIMYDMSGDENVEKIRDNWRYLIDVMKITEDDRYLRHNGKQHL